MNGCLNEVAVNRGSPGLNQERTYTCLGLISSQIMSGKEFPQNLFLTFCQKVNFTNAFVNFRTIDAQANAFEIDITIRLKGLERNKLAALAIVEQKIPRPAGTTQPKSHR